GAENSINISGDMQQPFYYSATYSSWRKLTYSTYPLDIRWGVGGDGTSSWNINGSMINNPAVSNIVFDYSGFTTTNIVTGQGYGTIKFTGNITVDGKLFLIENTYTLLQPEGYVEITVEITNVSGVTANNVRLWVGTRDDYIGTIDTPTKERGNLINGAFELIATSAEQSKAIKIKTADEAVLFYSNSDRAYSTINSCCSFTNATNQDPGTNTITQTGDGSYALYVRFNDLANGESDELTWYYAAGSLAEIDDIVNTIASVSGAISNITYTTADYSYTASEDGTTGYILVAGGSTAPTAGEIAAGVDYAGVTVLSSSTVTTTANIVEVFNLAGLTYNTNYDIYAVTNYFDGTSNVYSAIQYANFTTLDNDLPVGLAIGNQSECVNGTVSGLGLTITDVYPGDNTFTVTATSSNTSIVANADIVITGTGNTRLFAITPVLNASGTCTITVSIEDSFGAIGNQTFDVTFDDLVAPTVLTNNITVQLDATGNVSITPAQIDNGSTDNCTIASYALNVTDFTCANIGSNAVTLTVVDEKGNSNTNTATVTVEDITVPTVICQNINVYLDNTGNVSIAVNDIDGGTTDNCGIASAIASQTAFTCNEIGTNNVTLVITDNNSNVDSCVAVVTVIDTIAPVVVCQNITVQLDASGNASITAADIDNGSTDACGIAGLTASKTSFTCADIGANTVTLTVIDNNGNTSSCTSTVTVEDTIAPEVICPADQTLSLDANCEAIIPDFTSMSTVTDNCSALSGMTITQSPAAGTVISGTGTIQTIVITAQDQAGNWSSCNFTVTLEDEIAPALSCPSNQQVSTDYSCVYEIGDYTALALFELDNCDQNNVIVTQIPEPGTLVTAYNTNGISIEGQTTVTIIVEDMSGNASSCEFIVDVTCIDDLFIPGFFSPNADGKNDDFEINGLENFPGNKIIIFNRWGNEVFSMQDYDTSWKGESMGSMTMRNGDLPTGTYFYVLDLGNNENPKTGYIELRR
ncbi:MAG: gliding motility-associated C-terminal domain-containing protein, partial [Crocinitomicaceae bacterium]|nr:gliding motility-associated C-terminal domain-containing protein [Crocinitomicaceae bacterium]